MLTYWSEVDSIEPRLEEQTPVIVGLSEASVYGTD